MKMVTIGLSKLGRLREAVEGWGRRGIAAVLQIRATRTSADVPAQPHVVRPQASMGRDEQWSKLISVITGAVQRTTDAGSFHAAAEQQLDLAHYALCNLMDELSAVMAVPARRGPAVVRVLEPRSQRFIEGAWAA